MLYGRGAESGRLVVLLAAAADGRGGALVVRGEPGVGKTALLAQSVARWEGRLLWTEGVESEAPLAYAALHRLLRPVLGLADRLPKPQAEALLVALGERDGPPPDRFVVFVATLSLLVEAAEERPLVAVVDDAHWLDAVSAEALLFAARRLTSDPVAILFGAREGDVRRFDGPGLDAMTLTGLAADAAADLLAESTAAEVSAEVREVLLEHTGGNPLALVELPPLLSEAQLTGATPLPDLLPLTTGVENTFLDRCRRLSGEAQSLLLVVASDDSGQAAVIGAAAGRLGLDERAIVEAEQSGLVEATESGLRFRHPLVRSAVYGAATTVERRRAHAALASALSAAGEPDRRAWHLSLATPGPDEAVAAELEAVAERSARRGGHDAASAAWERAAGHSPGPEERAGRLYLAAKAAWVAGRPARAGRLADEARERAADAVLMSDIDRLRARIEWSVGSSAVGHRMIMAAALAVSRADPDRALEMAVVGTALATFGGGATGADLEYTPPPPPPGASPRTRCLAALLTGQGHVLGDRMAQAAPALREAFSLSPLISGDVDVLAITALGAFHLGDWQITWRDMSTVLEVARASGDVAQTVYALSRLPMGGIPGGRWDESSAATDEALTLGLATGQPALTAIPLAWRSLLSAYRGTSDGAESLAGLDELFAKNAIGIGVAAVRDIAAWSRGVGAANAHDFAAAHHQLGLLELPVMRRTAAFDRMEAAARTGHANLVRDWAEDLDGLAAATGLGWGAAAAAHGRALISDGPAAEAHYEDSLALHEVDCRPFDRARTQLAYGELLRRSGRRVEARDHLRASLHTFEDLSAAPWADRAAGELRASGESTRKRDASTALDLTAQELQVVRLVTQGLSNRDVAGRLFVSPRTVEYHLSHVYQKLGVRSRGELATLDPA